MERGVPIKNDNASNMNESVMTTQSKRPTT